MSSLQSETRDRDEQLMSAKKKLKSYRAKQALVSQKRVSLTFAHSKTESPSTPKTPLSGDLHGRPSSSGYAVAPSQDRTGLRARHAHRHSRNASISVPALVTLPPLSPSPSNRPNRSPLPASSSMGHLRMHSRSNSRTIPRSRPASSISLLGARPADAIVVAIEHPANDEVPFKSFSLDAPSRRSQHFLDSSTLFGAATQSSPRAVLTSNNTVAPIQAMPSDLFSGPSNAPASTSRQSRRLSRHARNTSISTKRESMEIMGGVGLGIADSASSTDSMAFGGRRRSSRISNLPSASVLFGAAKLADKENINNIQTWDWKSAMPTTPNHSEGDDGRLTALEKLEGRTVKAASILFDDQYTKMMPRSASNTSLARSSKRLSGHTRTESIQIPNLDEIHQNEILERRISWKASPNPEFVLETSDHDSGSARRESWRANLLPPAAPLSGGGGHTSPAMNSNYLSSPALPSLITTQLDSPQPEGLGTLVEEEEEEESLTPLRERRSLEMPSSLAEEDDRRQRREAEEEIVKRNRRSSLAPRPLKLKSRPPSLFLAPLVRNGIPHSPSLPELPVSPVSETTVSAEVTPKPPAAATLHTTSESSETAKVTETGDADGPSTSADDGTQSENAAAQAEEERQRQAIQAEILRAHRTSNAATPASVEIDSNASAPTPSRQGMRTLRLGSLASLASVMESGPVSSGPASASSNKRRSMIASIAPLPAAPLARESDSASAASARAARRSSIMYKASTMTSEASPTSSTSDSVASSGSVPLAVHDDLKAKANRDAVLLESTKKQVELLERELANESERSATERAELEQWSAEEKQQLFERARNAEIVASEASNAAASLKKDLATAQELVDDLQAEREVLQDDIDGWRSRCQDLQKTLRAEQAKAVEQRKLRSAARLRLRQLTDALERASVVVPADELGIYQALDQATIDATSASPMMNGSPNASPVLGDVPSPQITKLLSQMRQQIIDLAGSLEHERKQHIKTKDEIARLHDQTAASADMSPESALDRSNVTDDSHDIDLSTSSAMSDAKRSSDLVSQNKRHVFAYDSSMGSFGQSQSSASLSMATDDTTHTDNESDMSDWTGRKLLPSDSENVGLGVGGLHILDEIEEVSEVSESVEHASSSSTVQTAAKDLVGSPAWVDIEAGPMRPSIDVSESSFGGHFEDAEIAPPTPDLYRAEETFSSPLVMMEPFAALSNKTSSSSSAESHAAPPTPPLSHQSLNRPVADVAVTALSPRPEFIREWSFELGVRRSNSKGSEPVDVEDFFGIMRDDHLPALDTSSEALDLPPIVIRDTSVATNVKITKAGVPVVSAGPSRIASLVGGRRPPVARSAYARESIDATHRPTFSSTSVPIHRQRTDSNVSSSSASGLAAMGGKLGRMSLQNLTGAFSGLSGYLTNQSGAAVTAAAAATQMCGSQTTPGSFPGLHTDMLESGVQRRALEDEHYFNNQHAGARQYRGSTQISVGSATSISSQKLRRAFVQKDSVTPPKPTPVWMLNFEKSTLNASGPLISL